MLREVLMILFVTCSTLTGQLLIKHGMTQLSLRSPGLTGWHWLWAAMTSPAVITAIAVQGIGFIVWVIVISRVKLGVAFGVSGAFLYGLMALASWCLYGERLSLGQWLGLGFISAGVLMVSMLGQTSG